MTPSKTLQPYFSSSLLAKEEPPVHIFGTIKGTILKTWHSPGWRALIDNKDRSFTLLDLDNFKILSRFGDPYEIEKIFTRDPTRGNHSVKPFEFYRESENRVGKIAVSTDGKTAVTSFEDGTCIIWDIEKDEACLRIVPFSNGFTSILITPDGKNLITCDKSDFNRFFW